MTAYNLSAEWKALEALVKEFADSENGISEEDDKYLKEEAAKISGDIKDKINNVCKLIKNCKMEAEIADAERSAMKDEMDRLSKRAKAKFNVADRVKIGVLSYLMDAIGQKKIKTELFSVGYQATAESAKTNSVFNPDEIPVQYLKRELSSSAIKKAVEEGTLYKKEGDLDRGKLFYKDNGKEKHLRGVDYLAGEALVIR